MSDGMALYFFVLKAFVVLFFVLSLLALPMLVIANAGNDGLAYAVEPTWPGTLSLGNIGEGLVNMRLYHLLRSKDSCFVTPSNIFFSHLCLKCPYSILPSFARLRPIIDESDALVPRQGRHSLVLLQAVPLRRRNYCQIRDFCDQLLRSDELCGADCGLCMARDFGDSESSRN